MARKITIENRFPLTAKFAEDFIAEGHRTTKKVHPHMVSFTFNEGNLASVDRKKEIDYLLDLLYQAQIMRNETDRLLVNVDKRQSTYLSINV
jgi:hypothetical protein